MPHQLAVADHEAVSFAVGGVNEKRMRERERERDTYI